MGRKVRRRASNAGLNRKESERERLTRQQFVELSAWLGEMLEQESAGEYAQWPSGTVDAIGPVRSSGMGSGRRPARPLSAREFQVCVLASRHWRQKEIAARLRISRGRVASALDRACAKLGLSGHDDLHAVTLIEWRCLLAEGSVSLAPGSREREREREREILTPRRAERRRDGSPRRCKGPWVA